MSILDQWKELSEKQSSNTFKRFWDKYCDTEIRIYSEILDDPKKIHQGKFSELAEHWNAEPAYFMGFLDGVSKSVTQEYDLESITEESEISIEIELEKLYLNMLGAKANHLYSLPQWETLYTDDERHELLKKHRLSGVIIKEKTPGRNDPCPCGSGKKYKKCCGKTLMETDSADDIADSNDTTSVNVTAVLNDTTSADVAANSDDSTSVDVAMDSGDTTPGD
jgi:hypothetical protein